ncbi:hypothetical protein PFBG_02328 [Plasmodium falciparum 7G8]|uniref:Erythrocyte membrane protein 1 n=2 Tax=Plasmodium falciparum TaxID=5833 RepID=W7FDY4_PLAF8|nr:hypothetical protein PFBG_02328 [Plasmodium falciparum 7G8]
MALQRDAGGGEDDYKDAKELLDKIGQQVHDEVEKDAETYKGELKGDLKKAKGSEERASSLKTCDLVKEYYTTRLGDKNERNPCKELSGKMGENPFSDTLGGQCTKEKISGSTSTCGACAPYRRLHLCSHNLETINNTTPTASDTLLAEVCMAAKYEGDLIKTHYLKHELTNEGTASQLCTVLARSFADIGDIIRGRDLFLGNTYESAQRDQLDKKLKEIFTQIYNDVTTNGKKPALQKRYKKDDDPDFLKLREDWWTANRATIWEAITCAAKVGDTYFRATCSDGNSQYQTQNQCRCKKNDGTNETDQVPTYFDYVPQYLRWFEEWAEDFCHNQKLEFLKQREKYKSEIKKYTNGTTNSKRKKRSTKIDTYEGYEKKFYNELKKNNYGKVDKFLQKLNDEDICTKNGDIEEEGIINFKNVKSSSASGDGSNKTFYRTKYCEACPWCGVKKQNGKGGKWEREGDETCGEGKDYNNYKDTQIPVLTGDKTKGNMVQKYNKFCKNNGKNGATGTAKDGVGGSENGAASGDNSDNATTGYCGTNNSDKDPSLCEKWTCYYKKNENNDGKGNNDDINFCVQQKQNQDEKNENSMHYNAFFWDWVYHMLHDSLDWREEKDNDNKIDFGKPLETFRHSKYCEMCPSYEVKCNGSNRRGKNGECTPVNGNGKTWKEVFEGISGKSSDLTVEMIDRRGPFIEEYMEKKSEKLQKSNDLFKTSRLFKGLRVQNWKCKVIDNNTDVCKLDKFHQKVDLNEYTTFKVFLEYWLEDFLYGYYILKQKKIIDKCTENGGNTCNGQPKNYCACVGKWVQQKGKEWESIKDHFKIQNNERGYGIVYTVESLLGNLIPLMDLANDKGKINELKDFLRLYECKCSDNSKSDKDDTQKDIVQCLLDKLETKATSCQNLHSDKPGQTCDPFPALEDTSTSPDNDAQMPPFCPKDVEEDKKEPETDSDRLCDDKQEPKCNDFQKYTNSTCEPKKNLIGLGAHNLIASPRSNIYISPRVQQLCLQDLQNLKENNTEKNALIDALKKCAYNEGKGLYEYYEKNKDTIRKNGSIWTDEELKTYTLQAMKRSYADYGNIVKGDLIWDYHNDNTVNEIIFAITKKEYISENTNSIYYETKERQNLWKSIRTDVWKAMLCGYKDAVGDMNSLSNAVDLCKLPSTDEEDQFSRWFKEWGENYCIRREQELKQLKDKCKNGICKITDEAKKKECERLCEKYGQFLSNSKTQYEKQSIVYNELKTSISEFQNTDPFTFLKDKCNSKYCCFKNIENTNKGNKIIEYFSDEIKDICDCKKEQESEAQVHDLDKCPIENKNNKICNKYNKRRMCGEFKYSNSLDNWYGRNMLIPPRRRHLCLRNIIIKKNYRKGDISKFKDDLFYAAASEAKFLFNNYENKNESLQAIKYTFADIGDIIKGNDMMDDMTYKKIKGKLENVLDKTGNNPDTPEKWWEENKKHVWKAMLCGYKEAGGKIKPNDCNIPTEENTDQFLRWFQEWTEAFCSRKNELYKELEAQSEKAECLDGRIYPDAFKNACEKYRNFIANKKIQYDLQMYQYNKKYNKSQLNSKKVPDFLKNQCNGKCDCLSENFIKNFKLENPYETLDNEKLKNICDCQKSERIQPLPPADQPFDPTILHTTIPFGIAFALGSIAFLFLKKKTHSPVDLLRVLDIHKGDYGIPTPKSSNRYIPYASDRYKGKTYIYMEGDSDSGHYYEDTTDVTSSESEYEEMDINDIYVPGSPKYKTLIEVVLEPSGKNTTASGKNTTASGNNTTANEFISQYLQSEQNTEPNMLGYNVDNNTNPKTLHVSMEEKPFITSIHDRNLLSGEEYNYNVNMVNNDDIPMSDKNGNYTGIDLINDTLSGNHNVDIYDEVLKRKENELFGTEHHPKRTSTHSVAKNINSDPIHNQLELFHKWLDRHRDMCEKWNNKEELLDKLKEEWENETHSGNKHSDIPSGKLSDTPSDNNIHSDIHPSDIPSGKLSDTPSDNNIHMTYHTC